MTDASDRTPGGAADDPSTNPAARSRPRPTPRPRPGGARPSPRPRVAGSRRADEDAEPTTSAPAGTGSAGAAPTTGTAPPAPRRRPTPAPRGRTTAAPAARSRTATTPAAASTAEGGGSASAERRRRLPRPQRRPRTAAPADRPRNRTLALVLAVLCVVVAAGGGWLLWERTHPTTVDPAIFTAATEGVQAVYAYDYQDSDGSVQRKLDALTGDLRDQYETDLSSGGIIDTYQQVSATTSYDVLEVGLQQVNDSQDQATLVVFGQYVVSSVNSGTQAAPAGSECTVTDDGAQSCTQTVRVTVTSTDDGWKISELTLLTSS